VYENITVKLLFMVFSGLVCGLVCGLVWFCCFGVGLGFSGLFGALEIGGCVESFLRCGVFVGVRENLLCLGRPRVALVVPECSLVDVSPPFNLALLAACVSEVYDCDFKIFDGAVESDVLERVYEFGPDIVATSFMSGQVDAAFRFLDAVKIAGFYSVVGGVHASLFPDECLRRCDVVVVGEGERAFVDVVGSFLWGEKVRGVVFGSPVMCLDDLPFPRFDLIDFKKYVFREGYVKPFKVYPQVRLVTSRGCVGRCVFCPNSLRSVKLRVFSAEYVFRLVSFLFVNYGVRGFWFYDDEFLSYRDRAVKFASLVVESGLPIFWACQCRVSSVSKLGVKGLEILKSGGLRCVLFGVESAVSHVLGFLKAGSVTIGEVEGALSLCFSVGLPVYGSFIFGAPNESLVDMEATLSWVNSWRRRGLVCAGFSLLVPYPGTRLFELFKDRLGGRFFVPSHNVYESFIFNNGVDVAEFDRFVQKAALLFWVGNVFAMRDLRGFFTRSFVRCLFFYPGSVLEILRGKR